jgi:Xaa-Pro aminopeptidase
MSLKATSNLRLDHLRKVAGVDACLVENPLDLFYLTGLKLSAGRLLVHAKEALLLVDGRYLQIAKEKSSLRTELDGPKNLAAFCKKHQVKRLGFDGNHTSYDRFLQLNTPELTLIPVTHSFKTLRAIKEKEEIVLMKKSAALLWKGFQFLRKALKTGVTEKELATRFEIFCLENGAERLAFEPIIAFGKNGAMPHYRSQNVKLKDGDAVLIDIGLVLNNYHSDMTRVVFHKKEDPYIRHLYDIVQRAQKSALKLCRPGVKFKELDLAARKVMREEGVEELFVHSLGHGIGLQTHEYPRIKFDNEDRDVALESGMVFTVEPGLYVPGKGGVRFEDTIVITPAGYTNFYPKEI